MVQQIFFSITQALIKLKHSTCIANTGKLIKKFIKISNISKINATFYLSKSLVIDSMREICVFHLIKTI